MVHHCALCGGIHGLNKFLQPLNTCQSAVDWGFPLWISPPQQRFQNRGEAVRRHTHQIVNYCSATCTSPLCRYHHRVYTNSSVEAAAAVAIPSVWVCCAWCGRIVWATAQPCEWVQALGWGRTESHLQETCGALLVMRMVSSNTPRHLAWLSNQSSHTGRTKSPGGGRVHGVHVMVGPMTTYT
jgi:hypothetical protein